MSTRLARVLLKLALTLVMNIVMQQLIKSQMIFYRHHHFDLLDLKQAVVTH